MDACRRFETLGSETKGAIAPGTAGSVNFMFTTFPLHLRAPGCGVEQPRWAPHGRRAPNLYRLPRNRSFKRTTFFEVLSSKRVQCLSATLLSRGRLFSKAVCYKNVLQEAVLKKPPPPLVIRCSETRNNGNCFLTTVSYLKSVLLQINGYAYLI